MIDREELILFGLVGFVVLGLVLSVGALIVDSFIKPHAHEDAIQQCVELTGHAAVKDYSRTPFSKTALAVECEQPLHRIHLEGLS